MLWLKDKEMAWLTLEEQFTKSARFEKTIWENFACFRYEI
jgi:hypothetical protein